MFPDIFVSLFYLSGQVEDGHLYVFVEVGAKDAEFTRIATYVQYFLWFVGE